MKWRTAVGFGLGAVLLFAVAPAVLSDFRLSLLAKYLCFALLAIAVDLVWGLGTLHCLTQQQPASPRGAAQR